jgi:sugar phosphate isomerase/epimerase
MSIDSSKLNRRHFLGAAAGTAATGALGPLASTASAGKRRRGWAHGHGNGDLPLSKIGIQLWTVRNFLDDASLDLDGLFEMLHDAGYATVEIGGTYDGRTPTEFRQVAESFDLKVIGSHVPGGHGAFRNNLELVLDEAEALEIPYVGIASPDGSVPRTHDGFKAMAEEFNGFGEAARARGLKFYFHNHPQEFILDGGTPIYDTLLAETDRSVVWFELDIAWIEAGGQSAYEYVKDDPSRYPLFHVKDLRYNPNGARVTPPGVVGAGRRFDLVAVGKGDIDFAKIFSALRDTRRHEYLVEDDDAPSPVANPAGGANTAWFSRKYLAELEVRRRSRR